MAAPSALRESSSGIRKQATHFAAVTPPADLVQPHADLRDQLWTLAHALDATASTFQRCPDAHAAGDSTGYACEAHLAALSTRFGYVGEDLNSARRRVQRLRLPHGVLLPRMTSMMRRVAPGVVNAPARSTG